MRPTPLGFMAAGLLLSACASAPHRPPVMAQDAAVRAAADVQHGDRDLAGHELAAAEAEYRTAIAGDPTMASAYAGLAETLLLEGKRSEGMQEAQTAIGADPHSARTHDAVCLAYVAVDDGKSAASECQQAVSIDGGRAKYHHDLAIALALTDPASGLDEAAHAVSLAPDVEIYRRDEGDLLRRSGKTAEAIADLKAAVKGAPKDADAHRMLADAYWVAKRTDDALREVDAALAIDPSAAATWNEKGIVLEAKDDTAGSIAAFREAVRRSPDIALYHFNLGLELRGANDAPASQGSKPEGAAEIDRAVELAPADRDYLYDDAFAHSAAGDPNGAITLARRLVSMEPAAPRAHNLLGYMLEKAGDLDEAEKEYATAVGEKLDCGVCQQNYAHLLFTKGDLDGARAHAKIAAAALSDQPEAQLLLGIVEYRQGDLNDAEQQFRAAIALAPADGTAHFDLGMALAKQNKLDEAKKELEEFVAKAPADAPDLAEARETLASFAKGAKAGRAPAR